MHVVLDHQAAKRNVPPGVAKATGKHTKYHQNYTWKDVETAMMEYFSDKDLSCNKAAEKYSIAPTSFKRWCIR